ncbi:hypothetical protein [Nostoc sp.]|uniref:hypothetical protein n=1 Tax=Nostoc sp. TaxID=1180 RepID=UPI002FF44805
MKSGVQGNKQCRTGGQKILLSVNWASAAYDAAVATLQSVCNNVGIPEEPAKRYCDRIDCCEYLLMYPLANTYNFRVGH